MGLVPRLIYTYTNFVSFRTEDSMPAATVRVWCQRRAEWLRRHGIAAGRSQWHDAFARLSREDQREFREKFSREYLGFPL